VHLLGLLRRREVTTMFHLGRDCLCRREAPQVGGLTFPLCWRCSGMLAGVLAGGQMLSWVPALAALPLLLGLLGGLLIFPAGADVFCQLVSTYRSNRLRRSVTGLLLGMGLVLLSKVLVDLFR
jgi:uncharacterized membrane protein